METEWHVLTLLKIHVRTSHVSCLTHIYLEEEERVCVCACGGADPQHLEAVAQYPAKYVWLRVF